MKNREQAYRRHVAGLVERLPAEQQLVLSLHYCDGLNFHEIAEVLGITPEHAAEQFVQGVYSCVATGSNVRLRAV